MEYNSQRPKLIIKEYGRNTQKLAEYAATIPDREKRNQVARAIINLMSQANPQFRNIEEYKNKLWDHLIIISGYKLDVDSPYPLPAKPEEFKTIAPLPYPKRNIRFKHYGKNVETLIEKGMKLTDDDKKKGLSQVLANYMKVVYTNWNKENVNDDLIRTDLERMSKGSLVLDRNFTLENVEVAKPNQLTPRNPRSKNNFRKNNNRPFGSNDNRNSGGGGRNNNFRPRPPR